MANGSYAVAIVAAEALINMGDVVVEPLITALKDSDYSVRWYAAQALGKIGDARAVEPLIKALNYWGRYKEVSIYATKELVKKADPRVVEHLKKASKKDKSKEVRKKTEQVIASINVKASIKLFEEALEIYKNL